MTIPLMKSVGFIPEYAGPVDCVAWRATDHASGHGRGRFFVEQFFGVQYSYVIAALSQLCLYYFCVGLRWTAGSQQNLRPFPRIKFLPL
jgi:TRAP-type uncharacterized transport system fused permease subunit